MKANILLSIIVLLGCFMISETQQADSLASTITESSSKRSLEEEEEDEDDAKKPVAKPAAAAAKPAAAAPAKKSDDSSEDNDDAEKKDDKAAEETPEEDDDEKAARIQKEIEALNENTKKAFQNQFDSSEDFSYENMNNYMSGQYNDDMTEDQKIAAFAKLISKGPVSFKILSEIHFFFVFRSLNFLSQKQDNSIIFHKPNQKIKESTVQLTMGLRKLIS